MRLIGIVWDHTERYRRAGAPLVAGDLAGEEHERIVAAVQASDLEAATRALVDHLERACEVIALALTEQNGT
jgi:DNA-binding GntR family transcriptional regulator